MSSLTLENIQKRFGKTEIIPGLDLSIGSGELCVFVGPSGSGKSTLLRIIAGLEEESAGSIRIDDEEVNALEPVKRGTAMVFQSYALYPHMTVYRNIAFGLKLAKAPRDEIDRKVREVADQLQLTPLLDRLPKELSGGQRQRVAIGRALVRTPRMFLFDEPLSNLDAALRVRMRSEIAQLHDRLGTTMIYVTHDQVEAMTLADRIVVLNHGRIEQVGSPMDLYHAPANVFVAEFIGSPKMNMLPLGQAEDGSPTLPSGIRLSERARRSLAHRKAPATLGVRPEALLPGDAGDVTIQGEVELIERLGDQTLAGLRLPGGSRIAAKLGGDIALAKGEALFLSANADRLHVFDADGQRLESDAVTR